MRGFALGFLTALALAGAFPVGGIWQRTAEAAPRGGVWDCVGFNHDGVLGGGAQLPSQAKVFVLNTATTAASVTLKFRNENGSQASEATQSIPSNGTYEFITNADVRSAHVTSDQGSLVVDGQTYKAWKGPFHEADSQFARQVTCLRRT